MRIYIAGPITGTPDHPEKFQNAYTLLKGAGYTPINPLDVDPGCLGQCTGGTFSGYDGKEHTWGCFLKYDLAALLTCEAVYVLKGWETSRGVQLEITVASNCGMPIIYEEEVNEQRDPEMGRLGHVPSRAVESGGWTPSIPARDEP